MLIKYSIGPKTAQKDKEFVKKFEQISTHNLMTPKMSKSAMKQPNFMQRRLSRQKNVTFLHLLKDFSPVVSKTALKGPKCRKKLIKFRDL